MRLKTFLNNLKQQKHAVSPHYDLNHKEMCDFTQRSKAADEKEPNGPADPLRGVQTENGATAAGGVPVRSPRTR